MYTSTCDLIFAFVMCAAFGLVWWGFRAARKQESKFGKGWAQFGLTVLGVVIIISVFDSFNDVKSDGVTMSSNLNKQYVQSETVLSNYIDGFDERLGVANLETDKVVEINKIMVSILSGQSNMNTWNSPKSPFYLALLQVCPQVTLAQYQDLLKYIQDGRAGVQASQSQLLAQLSDFDTWRNSEIIFHPFQVKLYGFPDSNLHITVGGRTLVGAEAEAQMYNIVLNPMAAKAFETGREEPLAVK